MKSNLYIPKKIHVGFQTRKDTYTGKLAYIIYEDEKGVLRKKESWDGWRDQKINEVVLDNTPARFVFNKGIQRQGYFGSGRSVMRVYDTRDFEFEISIDNLVGILMHSDISKRDIVEECVFAWAGKDLILLPVNSEEYRASVEYTDKQFLKISTKDLVKGYLYEKKKSDGHLMYMGYHEFFEKNGYSLEHKHFGKKHVFYDINTSQFVVPSPSTIAKAVLEEVHADFAKIDAQLHKSYHLTELNTFDIAYIDKPINSNLSPVFYKKDGDNVIQVSYNNYYYGNTKIRLEHCRMHQGKITKNGKNLSIDFDNQYVDRYENNKVRDLFRGAGFHLMGHEIPTAEFIDNLKSMGFGNTLIAVDINNQKTNW